MTLRFSPARGAASLALNSMVRGPAGPTGATGAAAVTSAILDAAFGTTPNIVIARGASVWTGRALVGDDLPNPTPTQRGGVNSLAVTANEVLSGIGTDGVPTRATTTGTGSVVRGTSPTIAGATLTGPTVTGGMGVSSQLVVTGTAAQVFAVGQAGITYPAFSVSTAAASSETGVQVTSQTSGAGVDIAVTSDAVNEALRINALGTGTINIGNASTGAVTVTPQTYFASTSGINLRAAGSFDTNLRGTATATRNITLPNASTELVGTDNTAELTAKTLNASVGKGTWTASGTWTLPAITLGGAISGGGNQINNVIIGTSTPLAGFFTTLSATSALTYGGVTLSNSVTGTGSMVLSTSAALATPTLTTATLATRLIKGVYIIDASAVAGTTLTGTTAETTLATITIPANAMGANGFVRINWAYTGVGTAGTKTMRTKFGGTTFQETANGATIIGANNISIIANRNATNSQVGGQGFSGSGAGGATTAPITAAIDTTSAVTVLLTGQLANSADSMTLSSYLVELIVPS